MTPSISMQKATAAFSAGVLYAARLTGFAPKKIVQAEAGSILKACAAETPEADKAKVEQGAFLRALKGSGLTGKGQVTVNAGVRGEKGSRGRVFMQKKDGDGYRRTHDAGFQPLNQHYADKDWLALRQLVRLAEEKTDRALARAPQSVSLARGSWVRIADHAGIDLAQVPGGRISAAGIARARAAKAYKGQEVNNGTSATQDEKGKFALTLINRYPGGSSARLAFGRLLAFKVAGRAKFFMTAVRKGYDGSLEQTTKLFRGWTLKRASA